MAGTFHEIKPAVLAFDQNHGEGSAGDSQTATEQAQTLGAKQMKPKVDQDEIGKEGRKIISKFGLDRGFQIIYDGRMI